MLIRLSVKTVSQQRNRPLSTGRRMVKQLLSRLAQPLAVILRNCTPQSAIKCAAFGPVFVALLECHMRRP